MPTFTKADLVEVAMRYNNYPYLISLDQNPELEDGDGTVDQEAFEQAVLECRIPDTEEGKAAAVLRLKARLEEKDRQAADLWTKLAVAESRAAELEGELKMKEENVGHYGDNIRFLEGALTGERKRIAKLEGDVEGKNDEIDELCERVYGHGGGIRGQIASVREELAREAEKLDKARVALECAVVKAREVWANRPEGAKVKETGN